MHFNAVALAFPVILAVHNFEEYARDSSFPRHTLPVLPAALAGRRVVGRALILLTAAAAIVVLWNYLLPNPFRQRLCSIAILALLLNALGHLLLSLRRRRLLPGTLSAILFIVPYAAFSLYLLHTAGETLASLLFSTICAAITLIVAIPLFLSLGYITARGRRTHLK